MVYGKKIQLPKHVWKSDEIKDIENRITDLAFEWCEITGADHLELLYLKNRVMFGGKPPQRE